VANAKRHPNGYWCSAFRCPTGSWENMSGVCGDCPTKNCKNYPFFNFVFIHVGMNCDHTIPNNMPPLLCRENSCYLGYYGKGLSVSGTSFYIQCVEEGYA
jgi:hypothetical protein